MRVDKNYNGYKCSIKVLESIEDYHCNIDIRDAWARHIRMSSSGLGKYLDFLEISDSDNFDNETKLYFSPRHVSKFTKGKIEDKSYGFLMYLIEGKDPEDCDSYYHFAMGIIRYN